MRDDDDNFGCLPNMDDVPELAKPMIIEQAIHIANVVLNELEKEGKLFEVLTNMSRTETAELTKKIARKHIEEGHE